MLTWRALTVTGTVFASCRKEGWCHLKNQMSEDDFHFRVHNCNNIRGHIHFDGLLLGEERCWVTQFNQA